MRKKNILIDFNNLCYRTLFTKDVGLSTPGAIPNYKIWRFMVFDAIYQLIVRFEPDEVVLAVDHKNSWRKSYFSRYKESRKKNREKQDHIDWGSVFGVLHKYMVELKHHMPFKVLKVKSAEADDVIAVISIESNMDSIISSNDEDFLQLCSEHISLWNPTKKEFVTCEDPIQFLAQKCLTGQPKDDIFNAFTSDNWGLTEGTEGKRKPGLGIKTAEKILKEGIDNWLEKTKPYKKFDVEVDPVKNFERNRVLIDFQKIPMTIVNRVMDQYINYSYPPPRNIYQFFKKHGMRGFIEEFTRVESFLMKLY